jgi:hypothetical protein
MLNHETSQNEINALFSSQQQIRMYPGIAVPRFSDQFDGSGQRTQGERSIHIKRTTPHTLN